MIYMIYELEKIRLIKSTISLINIEKFDSSFKVCRL